jgi:replicative DNA helicase
VKRLDKVLAERAHGLIDLRRRMARGEKVRLGAPTGHPSFDRRFGGLPLGVVTAFAADTSVGKTAWAETVVMECGKVGKVLWFNLEDGNQNIADRGLGKATAIGATNLRVLNFDERAEARLLAVKGKPYENIWIEDETYAIEQIPDQSMEAARLAKEEGTDLVCIVVDYVQLVNADGASEPLKVKAALGGMQRIAKMTGAAVVGLSQVTTKKVMDRGYQYYWEAKKGGKTGDDLYLGYMPRRGDFHWASEFDQFAKMALAGFRPGPYRKAHGDTTEDKWFLTNVLKASQGPAGKTYRYPWIAELGAVGLPDRNDDSKDF